ncbi:MAG: hypothetical protein IT366_24885 [Candidatus Hydrogenedentes bacterium]|nr:hypothetical protein [Candidatus Hydrogenedentota bacterium]
MVRDRVFITMVSVSLLFHISMVTLFSIYVYVPVSRPKYAQLAINYLEPVQSAIGSMELTLRAPDLSNPPLPAEQGDLAMPEAERLTLDLPLISPPTLDISQLEQAEIIASKTSVQSSFREEQGDLWARTIDRFERLEDRARELMSISSVFGEEAQRQVLAIDQPFAALSAYIEWNLEPRDRKFDPAPPSDMFQKIAATELDQPILLTFRVSPAGDVLYVYVDPGSNELVQEIAAALRMSHFTPLEDLSGGNQIGTLVIKRSNGR